MSTETEVFADIIERIESGRSVGSRPIESDSAGPSTKTAARSDEWMWEQWCVEATGAIVDAIEAGECDVNGGVPLSSVSARLDRNERYTRDVLNELAKAGEIRQVTGWNPETHRRRKTFLPAVDEETDDDDLKTPWYIIGVKRAEWAEIHDVIPELLPFGYIGHNPIKRSKTVVDFLRTRPDYCKSVTRSTIGKRMDSAVGGNHSNVTYSALFCGWWPARNTDGRRQFMNPNYCHGHEEKHHITDREERLEWLELALRLGQDSALVADAFDVNPRTVTRCYAPKLDEDWHDIKARGRVRLDRTIATAMAWGHSQEELKVAFNCSSGRIGRALDGIGDQPIPGDPTYDAGVNKRQTEVDTEVSAR